MSMFDKFNIERIPYPVIGDEILVGHEEIGVERLVITHLPDEGKYHHKDESFNDYFVVGVEEADLIRYYPVRYDTLLQDWTQVGLTLDYEED